MPPLSRPPAPRPGPDDPGSPGLLDSPPAGGPPPPLDGGPPPPKTKREPIVTAAETTAREQIRQLARGVQGSTDPGERAAVMKEAITVVRECAGSALAGIGPTRQLFQALWHDQSGGLSNDERHLLVRELIEGLAANAGLGIIVERDIDFFHTLHTQLSSPTVRDAPAEGERYRLLRHLIDAVFADDSLDQILTSRMGFVASLLLTAARMANNPSLRAHTNLPERFIADKVAAMGELGPHLATVFVAAHWGADPAELGPDLLAWLFASVTVPEWNDPVQELAARGLNLLWTAGDYDRICQLIAAGVDCTVSAKAWGGPTREGVFSGYVQPLTHVLGRYVKSISMLDTPDEPALPDPTKVRGARQVVQAIGKLSSPPAILLDYAAIRSSEVVTLFAEQPGTFWGFEDVRLPYVLAARETRHGQRPLRMLDLWEAVGPALGVYANLVSRPKSTIAALVKQGAGAVRDGIKAGRREYDGIDEQKYLPEFEKMCADFLTYFAGRRPYGAYLETADRSGKAPLKLLAAYACKVGIHWSAARGIPLYYCLDGLAMSDVFSYKAYKIREIDAYLGAIAKPTGQLLHHGPFQEVITLAEVREILRHWDKFRDVVRFVEQGRLIPREDAEKRVHDWQQELSAADQDLHRTWSSTTTFEREILDMKSDPLFWNEIGVRERWKCVKELSTIELAAKNVEDPDLLLRVLQEDCPTLRRLALLPDGFVALFGDAVAAGDTVLPGVLSQLRLVLAILVCQGLRPPLSAAIDRHFGPPPLLLTAPEPLLDVELHVEPVPGAIPVVISNADTDVQTQPSSPPDAPPGQDG